MESPFRRGALRLVVLTFVPALIVGCGAKHEGDETVRTQVPVSVAVVQQDTITASIRVTGRLVPIPGGAALLSAPADAVVRTVSVQVGEQVRTGQDLVDLDVPSLAASAAALRAAATTAEGEARRQEQLLSQGITSRRQVDEARSQATGASSAADAAERLLDQARVRSPLDGGVQRVLVRPGERVTAGTPLVEVIRGGSLDLLAMVPAEDLARVRTGQVAVVLAEAGDTPHPGVVHAIAPGVDSASNSGSIVIRVHKAGPDLRPGAGATASVLIDRKAEALIVPDSALVLVGDSLSVFVVGPDSVAHLRRVVPGVRQGRRVEVRGDVAPGDRVATTGTYGLADGMHVVPVAPE
jgi:RND family efflux transporter MFP subunit